MLIVASLLRSNLRFTILSCFIRYAPRDSLSHKMAAPQPMAVKAPNHNSSHVTIASHAPRIASDSSEEDDEMPLAKKVLVNTNGHGKRAVGMSSSSEDEKPLVSFKAIYRALSRKEVDM